MSAAFEAPAPHFVSVIVETVKWLNERCLLRTIQVVMVLGQQQRVAIARAIAMEPKLMLFDEPTSALDPELVGEVLNVMKALAAEGMTMVVVTHEMGFAAHVADFVAFMEKGELVAMDVPDRVLHQPTDARVQSFLSTYHERNSF